MKLKLIEFAKYQDTVDKIDELPGQFCARAEELIKECIIINDFKWDGSYHQNGDFGVPIFELTIDGETNRYFFTASMRYWGNIMAEARELKEGKPYDYMDFYCSMRGDEIKAPKSNDDFIKPESKENLLEYISDLAESAKFLLKHADWDKILEDEYASDSKRIEELGIEVNDENFKNRTKTMIDYKKEFIPKIVNDAFNIVKEQNRMKGKE